MYGCTYRLYTYIYTSLVTSPICLRQYTLQPTGWPLICHPNDEQKSFLSKGEIFIQIYRLANCVSSSSGRLFGFSSIRTPSRQGKKKDLLSRNTPPPPPPFFFFFLRPLVSDRKKKQFLLFLILDAISFFGEGLVFIHRKTVASSCALFFLLISTHHASKLTRLLTSASGNKKKKLKLLIFILPRRDITNSFRLSFLIIYTLAVSESCMGHHSPSRVFSIPLYWCAQFASVVSFAMMISCASALFRRTHHSNKTKNEREKSYWNVGQVFAALRRRFSLSKFCHCRRGRSIQRTRPVSSECHSTLAVAWISTNLFPPHSGR